MMHVLILGGRGQLARALTVAYQTHKDVRVTLWSRPTHDISLPTISEQVVALQPDIVVNAAAWTDVDGAESQPAAAYAANALGPKYLAEGCRQCGAFFVQVSTNEVFAGLGEQLYREYDQAMPRSVYARSKLAGEIAAQQATDRLLIVRTAWLFSPEGTNFPRKICAAADRLGALRVVSDEYGNPSYAPDVAAALIELIATGRFGIYHLVNEGRASRFEFAEAVLRLQQRAHIPLTPISHTEWSRPADSPLHAVLVNEAAAALGVQLRHWREALHDYCMAVSPSEVTSTC
ncbi:MAG: dTDP-4-dehydrorhamnose reductase [Caldilineaceae bacterium]